MAVGIYWNINQKKAFGDPEMTPVWEMALDDIHSHWRAGVPFDDSLFIENCPEFKELDPHFKQLSSCRAEFMKCFYKGRTISIKDGDHWAKFQLEISDSYNSYEDLSVSLSLPAEKKHLPFLLKNQCHQVELPQGYYLHSLYGKPSSKINERLWHTSGTRYIVDRYLVRNGDILLWAKKKKKEELIKAYEKKEYFSPVTDLALSEMNNFCSYRGAQVLSAKVHDALTYHYGRDSLADIATEPPSINSAPHPFGPRKDDGPQFQKKFSKEGCSMVYSLDCLVSKVEETIPPRLGWAGVGELLGGPMEYVVNPTMPRRNLVASSYYFPYASSWHQAEKFAYWNGRGHSRVDFNFFIEAPPQLVAKKDKPIHYDVGFRCMTKKGEGHD